MLTPHEAVKALLSYGLTQRKIAELAHIAQPTVHKMSVNPEYKANFFSTDALRKAVEKIQREGTDEKQIKTSKK